MYAERHNITIDVDADGDATVYSPNVSGRVLAIIYTEGTLASGATDVTITAEATGEPILTLTNQTGNGVFYPRVPVHDETGTGATLDGTRKMREPVNLANDRIKIVVAQGGASKSGSAIIVVG